VISTPFLEIVRIEHAQSDIWRKSIHVASSRRAEIDHDSSNVLWFTQSLPRICFTKLLLTSQFLDKTRSQLAWEEARGYNVRCDVARP
jgi:hypothetical protein